MRVEIERIRRQVSESFRSGFEQELGCRQAKQASCEHATVRQSAAEKAEVLLQWTSEAPRRAVEIGALHSF